MFYSSHNCARTVQQEGYSVFVSVEKKVNACSLWELLSSL